MVDNKNSVISREKIAGLIWHGSSLENYSDWAIDQTMHRIRTKIAQAGLPYELKTKKGLGFVFLPK